MSPLPPSSSSSSPSNTSTLQSKSQRKSHTEKAIELDHEHRRELYGIYESQAEMEAALEDYGVVRMPLQYKISPSYPTNDDHQDLIFPLSNSKNGSKDIWGRFPAKEPAKPIPCPVCTRSVNASRFAQHLDKCMGISSRR